MIALAGALRLQAAYGDQVEFARGFTVRARWNLAQDPENAPCVPIKPE